MPGWAFFDSLKQDVNRGIFKFEELENQKTEVEVTVYSFRFFIPILLLILFLIFNFTVFNIIIIAMIISLYLIIALPMITTYLKKEIEDIYKG